MGSPTTSILEELPLKHVEETKMNEIKAEIVFYIRYMNDVFIIWQNQAKTEKIIDSFTNHNLGLRLNLEQKSSTIIHFLDVHIIIKGNAELLCLENHMN